ncbi:MAG: SusC/RagA family TonB-linked outer membrane protein [Bacteroidales bacterium]|nr:SusC/RagA family TonB-linked outer membrane protein [Bacteroidales bacterium]
MKRLISVLISITILSLSCAFAQYKVKGQVVDAIGPVVGVAVLEQGTQNGTETDLDGLFEINVASASSMIEFSLIGYKTILVRADQISVVVLSDDTEFLDEVVVIGYGTVKKSDMTGSVSAVKADQLNKGSVTSPADLLKGKSAGVVITSGDGAPGSGATIRIRGGSSLSANNDPLIVIDGLPVSNTGISGMADALSSINPSDIETYTVLKDASATAIYGSRASNGVIIITTKKGNKFSKGIKVSADFQASLAENTKYVNVMTGDQMRAAVLERYGEDSETYKALGNANTDWQRAIYQLGQTYEANVGLSGNIKFGKAGYMPYRISGGYISQDGTLKTSWMDRGTLALNLNPSFLDEHLTISLNGKGMMADNHFANTDAISQAVEYDPTQHIYGSSEVGLDGYRMWGTYDDATGTFLPNTQATQNPLASLYQKKDVSQSKRFIGNAQVDYKIHGLEDLRLNVNAGIDMSYSGGTVDIPQGAEQSWHAQLQSGSGAYTIYHQKKIDKTLEAYADYSKTINKHSFGVMAGYSWQHFYVESDSKTTKKSDESVLNEFIDKSEYFLVSFFARANYSYDNRYMATVTVREDGTSRFQNNKWGLFPSVALGWNIKGEQFLKNEKAVSNLKLRLSWGQTGQQDLNAGDYPTLASYQTNLTGSYYQFGDRLIIPISPLGYNADLKWETTTTYNVGIDYGFLNDRIYGTVDVYYRDTKDLLNYTPVPAGSNLKNYLSANIGSLVNKGVEVELNGVAIQTNAWNWTIGVNGAWNANKITKLTASDSESYKGVATGGISGGVGNTVQRYMVGYPVNTFYVYQQVYDQDGAPIPGAYVDRNQDGKIDSEDLYCYKKAAPDFTLGFNTTLSWKNLSLNIAGHGNFGNYVYNNNAARLSLLSDLWTNNFVANRYYNAMERGFNNAEYLSDYWIEDASFFRIDRITLSYLFDLKKGGSLSVFGTVQNVATFTNYTGIDPEVYSGIDNNMYPRPRTWILGLKYAF